MTHSKLHFYKWKGLGAKLCVAFQLFSFWKELWFFKVKESMLFVEEEYKVYNKKETELKMENPTERFKACACYFHQIFVFLPNDSPSKTMKNAYFI